MISNNKFMEQFKALEHSENFKEIINPMVSPYPKYIPNDKRFNEGIRIFTDWFKQTYLKKTGGNEDKKGV